MGFRDDIRAINEQGRAEREAIREETRALRNMTPEERKAYNAAKKAQKAKAKAAKKAGRDDLRTWRMAHPAELQLNSAAIMRPWPSSERGVTKLGPVAGARAEFFNADAHKAWTATRLVGGVATLGASAALAGRKNKGHASINLTFPSGAVQSYTVKPDSTSLRVANQYVTAFNTLSVQLAAEAN